MVSLFVLSLVFSIAQSLDNGVYYIFNKAAKEALHCSVDPSEITTTPEATSDAQKFEITKSSYGGYQVKCVNNGKCWDIWASSQNGDITQNSCKTSVDQRYDFDLVSGNTFEITVTNRYLEVMGNSGGAMLITDATRDYDADQHFTLISADFTLNYDSVECLQSVSGIPSIGNGVYYIFNKATEESLHCSDDPSKITTTPEATSDAPQFQFTKSRYGGYQVKCVNNGKCWDIWYSSANGDITQNSCYTTVDQRYEFDLVGNAYEIKIRSRYLEIIGNSGGAMLITDPTRDNDADQQFSLIKADLTLNYDFAQCLQSATGNGFIPYVPHAPIDTIIPADKWPIEVNALSVTMLVLMVLNIICIVVHCHRSRKHSNYYHETKYVNP